MKRPNRDRRQAERNTDRRNADSPPSHFMHLHRALFDPNPCVRRMSSAWIRALHRQRDRAIGLDLCWALGQREDWPAAFAIPAVSVEADGSRQDKLARGVETLSGRQLRLLNEIPGVAAALIVMLVVAQPF